ncbi:MAG: LytTR family DNA-binding domain-containing protein [Chitinophagaceae bacterium]|jgi:hypothetical protein
MGLVRYRDLSLRVIASVVAAHFIVVYGVEKTFFQILLTPIYYVAMAASVTIAFILISFVRWVYIKLDRKFDWVARPLERTALQVLFGFIAPGILAFVLAFIYFSLRGMNILKTLYLRFDYPIILLLILFLNLYYLAYYFYGRMRIAETMLPQSLVVETENSEDNSKSFLVNQGIKNLPIPLKNIAYFFREGDLNFLRTFDGEDFAVSYSLDEIQQNLKETDFFRANRQVLVSRKACRRFEALLYNKLELFVEPGYKGSIIISQKRAKNFRDWIVV